jgi:single-strand DNA-binding protein
MSSEITVTGSIAEPDMRFSQQGKAMLNLRINATYRRLNKQTNEWEDHGAQLWYGATLWERDAERWAELLHRGDQVSIRGIHVKREYQAHDGSTVLADDIANAKMLGYRPKATQPGGQQPQQYAPQPGYAQPASDDPWRTQGQQPQPPQPAPQQAQAGWGPEQGFPQPQNPNPPF